MTEPQLIELRRTIAQGPHPTYGWYTPTPWMTLDGMSAQEYNQLYKGQIKDAVDTIFFDRLRMPGGTAIGAGDKQLFGVALNGSTTTADGGTSYKKGKDDTNMKQANEMAYGNIFIVESFQCEVILTDRKSVV